MSYTKTIWKDRIVQFAKRFTKSNETSTSVTLEQDPGVVTEEGTPVSAALMNKIEQGIADAQDTADAALPKAGGTMSGDIAFSQDVSNIKNLSRNMFISGKNAAVVMSNAYFENDNYLRYDITQPAAMLFPTKIGEVEFRTAPAGANPIEWTNYEVWGENNLPNPMQNTGAEMSGHLTLKNNVFLRARSTGGSIHNLAQISSGNFIILGDIDLQTRIYSASNPIFTIGGATYTAWSNNNLQNPAQTDVENTFTKNQKFSIENPSIIGENARMFMVAKSVAYMCSNIRYDGAWHQLDSSKKSSVLRLGEDKLTMLRAPAGSTSFDEVEVWDKSMLRWNSDHLEYNDGGTWKAVGGVKSVQRGTTSITGTTAKDVTISTVATGKTYVIIPSNLAHYDGDAGYSGDRDYYAQLMSATSIRITPRLVDSYSGGSSNETKTISWQVIEHN